MYIYINFILVFIVNWLHNIWTCAFYVVHENNICKVGIAFATIDFCFHYLGTLFS
jgi:hypothetical protein